MGNAPSTGTSHPRLRLLALVSVLLVQHLGAHRADASKAKAPRDSASGDASRDWLAATEVAPTAPLPGDRAAQARMPAIPGGTRGAAEVPWDRGHPARSLRARGPLRTAGKFTDGDLDHLSLALRLATERLRGEDSCRSLFDALGADGEALLSRSYYVRAKQHEEKQICRSRVIAFTGVGSPVTRLCRSFGRLDTEQAALILLHEALHFAGLGESPRERGAPTSAEINQRVATSCGR